MVQTNKILTVSYGTFSCTLEGFDDSFDTMKAIAEYFRDLAADDRYFGAEPAQPDADMLARIAQKEISRQVEAHQDNNGILLRAAAPAAAAAPAPEPTPEPVTQAEAPMPQADVARDQTPIDTAETGTEDAVAQVAVEPEVAQTVAADAAAAPVAAAPVAAAPEEAPTETAPLIQVVSEDIVEEPTVEIIEPDAKPQIETMADKLARIRAVVERNDGMVEEQIEDAEELAPLTATSDPVDQADDPEVHVSAHPDQIDEDPDEDAPLVLNETYEDQTQEGSDAQDDTVADSPENLMGVDAFELTQGMMDSVKAVTEVQPTDETRDDLADAAAEADEVVEDISLFSEMDDSEDDDTQDNLLTDDDAIAPQAMKVKRETLDQVIAQSETPNGADQMDLAQSDADESDTSLSAEDEADLQAELDAVAAELADAQAALNPPDDGLDDQTVVSTRAREGRTDAFKGSTPPVTRILAETEDRMDEPEGAMSREAYEHLRAAVKATKAESEAHGGELPKVLEDHAYRDDLANVVRPRRPESGPSGRQRPDETRAAPLKLVAEQRIDADTILPQRGPVRPRRIAAEAEEEQPDTTKPGGFAAFAQEVGAKDLPELLEAAAAYMSFVEGWEQFSRPQLMTRVKQVEEIGFNREDGLRTFGQLLREGKIEKTSGGRFTASERIGFRPARKAAG